MYSDAQGGLSLPGDDLQTGAQNNAHPATTAHWENVENLQLTNWYLSHNNLVFKDSAVEMNVCLICRQRSVSQINPSHWLKHKRTRRKWNCIFHRSVTWMRCSNEVSHTTDFILHRSRVQCGQLVTAATVFWCRQTAHCHNLTSPPPKYHVPALPFTFQLNVGHGRCIC